MGLLVTASITVFRYTRVTHIFQDQSWVVKTFGHLYSPTRPLCFILWSILIEDRSWRLDCTVCLWRQSCLEVMIALHWCDIFNVAASINLCRRCSPRSSCVSCHFCQWESVWWAPMSSAMGQPKTEGQMFDTTAFAIFVDSPQKIKEKQRGLRFDDWENWIFDIIIRGKTKKVFFHFWLLWYN